jgi:hypothetical protein
MVAEDGSRLGFGRHLENRPKAAASLDLEVSAGWGNLPSRGLWGGNALLLSSTGTLPSPRRLTVYWGCRSPGIPHHLLGYLPATEEFTVQRFRDAALPVRPPLAPLASPLTARAKP